MWTAVWSIVGARLLYSIVQFDGRRQPPRRLQDLGGRPGRLRRHDRRLSGQLVQLPQGRHPPAALGGRGGALAWCWARPSPASAACCSAATTASARTCPGPSSFPARQPGLEGPRRTTSSCRATPPESFPVHPTQLYETLAGLFLFGLLMFLRRVRKFSGHGLPGLGHRLRHPAPDHRGVTATTTSAATWGRCRPRSSSAWSRWCWAWRCWSSWCGATGRDPAVAAPVGAAPALAPARPAAARRRPPSRARAAGGGKRRKGR